MKKQLKIVMLIISFLCLSNLTGCTLFTQPGGHFYGMGGSTSMPFDGTFEDRQEKFPLLSDEAVIISSTSEFDEVFTQSPYIKDYGWSNEDFINTTSKFDEEYFENNQIVCFFITAPNPSYTYKLSKTNYSNGVLTITIKEKYSNGIVICVIAYWLAMIEIEKVPSDTVVNVVYKNNLLQNLFW